MISWKKGRGLLWPVRSFLIVLSLSLAHIYQVNAGASARLSDAVQNPNSSYNGSLAITVYAAEARNENA